MLISSSSSSEDFDEEQFDLEKEKGWKSDEDAIRLNKDITIP